MNTFIHDSNARNDEKVLAMHIALGAAGYGVYFMILERMRDATCYMCAKDYNVIAFDLRVDASLVKQVVENFGLFSFTDDGKRFYSESFTRRMQHQDDIREKRAKAGRKSGAVRGEGKELKPRMKYPKAPKLLEEPTEPWKDGDEVYDELLQAESWCDVMNMRFGFEEGQLAEYVNKFKIDCHCRGTVHVDVSHAKRHFNDWLRIVLQALKDEEDKRKSGDKRRGTAVPTQGEGDYASTF